MVIRYKIVPTKTHYKQPFALISRPLGLSAIQHANKIAFVFLYFLYNILRPPMQNGRVNLHFKVIKGSFLILYLKQVIHDNNNFFSKLIAHIGLLLKYPFIYLSCNWIFLARLSLNKLIFHIFPPLNYTQSREA